MIEEKEVYIHIGYPKTATTTLQKYFLSKQNEEFFYIGYPISFEDNIMLEVIRFFTHYDNLYFYNNINKIKKYIYDYIDQISQTKIILSDEAFSVGRYFPGFNDRKSIAEKLKLIFPNARIIVTIRNQKDMIKSYYLQVVKFEKKNNDFTSFLEKEIELDKYSGNLSLFKYYETIKLYADLFNKDNLKVLFFENLSRNIDYYAQGLVSFLDLKEENIYRVIKVYSIQENTQLTQGQYIINKLLRMKIISNFNNIFFNKSIRDTIKKIIVYLFPSKLMIEYKSQHLEYIKNYFIEDNKKLEDFLQIKLNRRYSIW
jgi:hypothetical protein